MPTPKSSVPTISIPSPKAKVRANLEAFGGTWRLIRPNQVLGNATYANPEEINPGYLHRYMLSFVHPEDRDKFLLAIMDDPAVDLEYLFELMKQMHEAVYADIEGEAKPDDED